MTKTMTLRHFKVMSHERNATRI